METPTNSAISQSQLHSFATATFLPVLVGGLIQAALLGIITVLCFVYYSHFGVTDPRSYLFLVGTLFVLNALEGGMNCDIMLRGAMVEYGPSDLVTTHLETWTLWAQPGITATIIFLAHLFWLEQCWRATKKSWVILAFLGPLLLMCLGSGVAFSMTLFKRKLVTSDGKISAPMALWLEGTVITDISIWTVAIIRALREYDLDQAIKHMEANILSADFFLILTLQFFVEFPGTTRYLIPQSFISCIYTIGVLAALLRRNETDAPTDCLPGSSIQDQTVEVTMVTLVKCDIPCPDSNRPQAQAVDIV
ncbi:hypothetical protein DFH09DRAFT_1363728 [Mycena vulgaris]|nr:hypothetical protein DFH09DRAFT_1363728 [Mycena vulgaris]